MHNANKEEILPYKQDDESVCSISSEIEKNLDFLNEIYEDDLNEAKLSLDELSEIESDCNKVLNNSTSMPIVTTNNGELNQFKTHSSYYKIKKNKNLTSKIVNNSGNNNHFMKTHSDNIDFTSTDGFDFSNRTHQNCNNNNSNFFINNSNHAFKTGSTNFFFNRPNKLIKNCSSTYNINYNKTMTGGQGQQIFNSFKKSNIPVKINQQNQQQQPVNFHSSNFFQNSNSCAMNAVNYSNQSFRPMIGQHSFSMEPWQFNQEMKENINNRSISQMNNYNLNNLFNYQSEEAYLLENVDKLIKDQSGCRILQKKLNEKNSDFLILFYEKIKDKIPDLINGQFGNYLIQKFAECCLFRNIKLMEDMLQCIKDNLLNHSIDPYGSRVIQKILELMNKEDFKSTILEKASINSTNNNLIQKQHNQIVGNLTTQNSSSNKNIISVSNQNMNTNNLNSNSHPYQPPQQFFIQNQTQNHFLQGSGGQQQNQSKQITQPFQVNNSNKKGSFSKDCSYLTSKITNPSILYGNTSGNNQQNQNKDGLVNQQLQHSQHQNQNVLNPQNSVLGVQKNNSGGNVVQHNNSNQVFIPQIVQGQGHIVQNVHSKNSNTSNTGNITPSIKFFSHSPNEVAKINYVKSASKTLGSESNLPTNTKKNLSINVNDNISNNFAHSNSVGVGVVNNFRLTTPQNVNSMNYINNFTNQQNQQLQGVNPFSPKKTIKLNNYEGNYNYSNSNNSNKECSNSNFNYVSEYNDLQHQVGPVNTISNINNHSNSQVTSTPKTPQLNPTPSLFSHFNQPIKRNSHTSTTTNNVKSLNSNLNSESPFFSTPVSTVESHYNFLINSFTEFGIKNIIEIAKLKQGASLIQKVIENSNENEKVSRINPLKLYYFN